MKTMTCKELGGACDYVCRGETFEEIAENSKSHAMTQMEDPAHQEAMGKMMELMKKPEELEAWFAETRATFEAKEHE